MTMQRREKVLTVNGKGRQVMTPAEARNNGFRQMTSAYQAEGEFWMMENVAQDMDRANKELVVVPSRDPHGKECGDWWEIWKQ